MPAMKRIKTDLLALGIAAAVTALVVDRADPENASEFKRMTRSEACAESALYLDGPVTDVRFHRAADRWSATDGRTTAWLDARTGELLEVELHAVR